MERKDSRIVTVCAATALQQGIYFHHLYEPAERTYVNQASWDISGDFAPDVFQRSLKELFHQHEALRTNFYFLTEKKLMQVVYAEKEPAFVYNDLSESPPHRCDAFAEEEFLRPFNLNADCLFRAAVAKKASDRFRLILTWHHIILDGWSVSIVLNDLVAGYEAIRGNASLKRRAPWSQSKYMRWVESRDLIEVRQFWSRYLEGYLRPSDPPWRGVQGGDYVLEDRLTKLSSKLSQTIRAFAVENGVTPRAVFQTAWAVVLQRHLGVRDVVFGTVISGRSANCDGIEEAVGLFINTVPVRFNEPPSTSVKEALSRRAFEASQIEAMGILPLVEVEASADMGRGLVDHLFVFENYPREVGGDRSPRGESGLRLNGVGSKDRSNYNFSVTIGVGDQFGLRFSYNKLVLPAEYVERLVEHYSRVIEAMLVSSAACIGEIGILRKSERETLLHGPNATICEVPRDKCVHELIEARAIRDPHALAVVSDGEMLTYRDLNERANRLAGLLRDAGVRPDHRVALMMDRWVEMISCILGILKSGAAYVPIDPSHPGERIEFVVQDADCRIVVTQPHYAARVKEMGRMPVTPVSHPGSEAASVQAALAGGLAYVIYTSGSTGQPKGVMVEHAALINLVYAHRRVFGDDERRRVLQFAPLSFDASVWEIFPTLCSGAALYIHNRAEAFSSDDLYHVLRKQKITFATLPTSLLSLLLPAEVDAGTEIIVAGEACSVEAAKPWRASHRLVNAYGPTETTVCATCHRVGAVDGEAVPIGRPIANMLVYVLDERFEPVPTGTPGELCVAGRGLARGYLARPDLTAERFVANPFGDGERLYRTGDVARWRPDGCLEMMGRIDGQLKIRGHRVEPGEIESVLRRHPDVSAALAVARDTAGVKSLCAYYVGRRALPAQELRSYLAGRVPAYLVPNQYVQLDRFPLTGAGKIDRKRLPLPDSKSDPAEMPLNETEEKIGAIFAETLGLGRVQRNDNFFEMGGHSLTAMRLVGHVKKRLGVEIELKELFNHSTVATLADVVKQKHRLAYEPIRRADRRSYYPASSAQKRLYALQQIATGVAYNVPVVYAIRENLDFEKLGKSFQAVVERHGALRTWFELVDGEVVQRVADRVELGIDYVEAPGVDAKTVMRDFVRPFDLGRAPLARVKLVKRGDADHLLCVDMHHIVSDGQSMRVLLDDFLRLYAGETLPVDPVQYIDYVLWQRENRSGAYWRRQEEYWLKRFSGGVPILRLPTDFPRPPVQSFEGGSWGRRLDEELTKTLREYCEAEKVTLFMLLLAAYHLLLSKYTGQEDIVVGTSVMGRDHPDLEGIVGTLLNAVALRGSPEATKSFREFLHEMRETVITALAHQGYPFEDLAEKIETIRDPGRNPIFDTLFLVNRINEPRTAPGAIPATTQEFDFAVARFDLTVRIQEAQKACFLSIEYRTSLFHPETIARLGRHYEQLLRQVLKAPECSLGELELTMGENEEQAVENFESSPRA